MRSASIRARSAGSPTLCPAWFYAALFECEARAKKALAGLQGRTFQYDQTYKGILELLYADSAVCGLSLHWPNGSTSTWSRKAEGCSCNNIRFGPDGSIDPMVGLYARDPGTYSPLVAKVAAPVYGALVNGSVPTWESSTTPDGLDD
jgi:hypothetical protein